MTFTDALRITQNAPRQAPPFVLKLACGFVPLHLRTFLGAHVQQLLVGRSVTVTTGLYGDLAGTLESIHSESTDAVAVALEWPDLDARLGFRGAGPWGVDALADVPSSVRSMLERIGASLALLPAGVRCAILLPTLPLPPLFHTPGWQAQPLELVLQRELFNFAAEAAASGRVAFLSPGSLNEQSPFTSRYDLKSDLLTGQPYTVEHADRTAMLLARTLLRPAPKKGVITDLDDTLWSGIVGETGPAGVHWDLASHNQLHGLYQKVLASLSEQGTLVAVASKNDPAVIQKAFQRPDLLLGPERIFPIEAHWDAKSNSVSRILKTWNIAADSVIFVDDSPMELAEVAAQHPGIECMHFRKDDYPGCLALFHRLRDMCGKEAILDEDKLRLESIRSGAAFRQQTQNLSTPESFLQSLKASVSFNFHTPADARLLELMNKTNQFNLNGIRYTESDWRRHVTSPGFIVAGIGYEDRFGPLGTIAVVSGVQAGSVMQVDGWVMSCRAFSRRIEHQCLKTLFERTGAEEIEFRFAETDKNGPLQDFFAAVLGHKPSAPVRLSRATFESHCPPLYHEVHQVGRNEANE